LGSSPAGPQKRRCLVALSGSDSSRPASSSRSRRGTPVHIAVDTPAAPQLKPCDFLCMFCSLRRLPAQAMVTVRVRAGRATIWSMQRTRGRFLGEEEEEGGAGGAASGEADAEASSPTSTVTVCVPHSLRGTAPWFLTKCRAVLVTNPEAIRSSRGASLLKGCLPVSRSIRASRGTHASLVPASACRGSGAAAAIPAAAGSAGAPIAEEAKEGTGGREASAAAASIAATATGVVPSGVGGRRGGGTCFFCLKTREQSKGSRQEEPAGERGE